jgi:hypothetical protein
MLKKKGCGEVFKNRNRLWRNFYIVLFFLVSIFLVAYFGFYQSRNSFYVAKVHNQWVHPYEFNFFLAMEKKDMEQQANLLGRTDLIESFWNSKIAGEEAGDVAKKRALEALREFKILKIKAKEKRISLTQEELREIEQILEQQNAIFSDSIGENSFERSFGVSFKEYQKIVQELKVIQKFMDSFDNMEEEAVQNLLDGWKKDPKYEMILNAEVLENF